MGSPSDAIADGMGMKLDQPSLQISMSYGMIEMPQVADSLMCPWFRTVRIPLARHGTPSSRPYTAVIIAVLHVDLVYYVDG